MEFEYLTTAKGLLLDGPLLLNPKVFIDERGFFFESWNQKKWADLLHLAGQNPVSFVQDNHSSSSQGVLRGLHYQIAPHMQGKLVRCIVGKIFDIAVDLRINHSGFGSWVGVELSAENKKQMWIPNGFAHGFLTLSDHAEVQYKTTDFWNSSCERSIRWNDPKLGIQWPLDYCSPSLSLKDSEAPLLENIKKEDLFQ